MQDIVLALLAAAGVDQFPEAGVWCINEGLLHLDEEGTHRRELDWWIRRKEARVGYPAALVMPSGRDGSTAVEAAIRELLGEGRLIREEAGPWARLRVDARGTAAGRRVLFSLSPEDAAVFYTAGRSLARRVSTSLKKWQRPSVEGNVRSSTPARRLQSVPGL